MTTAEQQALYERMGRQEALNRWSQAVDGLTNALSFAKTYQPPAEIPANYTSAAEFLRRLESLSEIAETWRAGA